MCSRHVGTKRTMEKLNSCHLPPYIFLCLNFWLFSFLQPKLFLINTCVILSVFSTNSIMPQLKFQNYVILKVMRFRAGNFQSPIDCVQPCVSLSDTIGSSLSPGVPEPLTLLRLCLMLELLLESSTVLLKRCPLGEVFSGSLTLHALCMSSHIFPSHSIHTFIIIPILCFVIVCLHMFFHH